MSEASRLPPTAIRYEAEVDQQGRLQIAVPFAPGSRVVVFVIEESSAEVGDDLLSAAQSSLDFWDNPFDDEDWNDATSR